jgi:GWxTD domain-containing protein
MNPLKRSTGLAVLLCLWTFFLFSEQPLSPRHREWLEDVSPIITRTEREVFSKLRTEADRDKFIQFFWRQRDPRPDTAENEFYKGYMERVRFADQNFGRGTSKRGSQTERGYYYLMLGPPLERQMFSTESQIWPLELWFYKGEVEYGLPPYFYLIFFQEHGLGEYRLYSPGVDGPERLVVPTLAPSSLTRAGAYQIIKKLNSELAGASLNYTPGDQNLMTPEIASTSIMASIRSYPDKKFSDTYARNYLAYKDYVTTEYSDKFIGSSFAARVFRSAGQAFVHWTLEPQKINFVEHGGRYEAFFDLVLRLEDPAGNLVLEKTEEIPLSVTPEQYKAHERQIFAFQDIFPVVPGRFKLLGLLKNKSAQDFTSFNALITVPPTGDPSAGGIILYHSRENMTGSQAGGLRAFAFGGRHYLVNARNDFAPKGEMGIFVQFPEMKGKEWPPRTSALIEVRAADSAAVSLSQRKNLAEVMTPGSEELDFGLFSLADLKPGYYSLEFSLVEGDSQKRASLKENFVLLAQAYPVSPWVYSRVHPPFPSADHLFWLGTEFFLTGQYPKALDLAERAVKLKDEPRSRLLLAQAFYGLHRYQEALTAAQPLAGGADFREALKIMAASYAGLKDWAGALVPLEKLLAEATEVSVLSLAGECYFHLNQPEKALPLLEKSLEIEPNQPAVKELLQRVEAKIKS